MKRCGLIVCVQTPYLDASPDSLVSDDTVIEVKCPYNGRHEQIVSRKHFSFLEFNADGEIVLKHNSKYQIQGQLYISNRKYCLFCSFFIQRSVSAENWVRPTVLWNIVVAKIRAFFVQHLRPFLLSLL